MGVMCVFGKTTTWLLQNSFGSEASRGFNCPILPEVENVLFWESRSLNHPTVVFLYIIPTPVGQALSDQSNGLCFS